MPTFLFLVYDKKGSLIAPCFWIRHFYSLRYKGRSDPGTFKSNIWTNVSVSRRNWFHFRRLWMLLGARARALPTRANQGHPAALQRKVSHFLALWLWIQESAEFSPILREGPPVSAQSGDFDARMYAALIAIWHPMIAPSLCEVIWLRLHGPARRFDLGRDWHTSFNDLRDVFH